MNAKKFVLKNSPFTSSLTRALKNSTPRPHCNVDADGMIYICTGYFAVKLNGAEYDAFVRPVTQRDAGNWILDEDGAISDGQPIDIAKAITDAANDAAHIPTAAPMLFNLPQSKCKAQLIGYYSETGGFVTAFNSAYSSIVSPALERKSGGGIKPMVVYDTDPIAIILPVKVDDKPDIVRTVRAWFVDDASSQTKNSETVEKLCGQLEELRRKYAQEHKESEYLKSQFDRLNAVVADKNAEIAALLELLNAQPKPQEVPADAPQPQDTVAVLLDKLSALPEITATVKGAKTAAPVVWLTGSTNAHEAEIKALGGKWSHKRAAWYFRIA